MKSWSDSFSRSMLSCGAFAINTLSSYRIVSFRSPIYFLENSLSRVLRIIS